MKLARLRRPFSHLMLPSIRPRHDSYGCNRSYDAFLLMLESAKRKTTFERLRGKHAPCEVIVIHALAQRLIPVITVTVLQVGFCCSGAI